MNEAQKQLIKKSNAELGPEELERISHMVAGVKRFVDIICCFPDAREEYLRDDISFLNKNNINIDSEDIKFLWENQFSENRRILKNSPTLLDEIPESIFRYYQFLQNKFIARDKMINELCAPDNAKMKKWRERQIFRCNGDLGGVNRSFIHTIVTYELACGCSVGCEFCGLQAKKLTELFRNTPENMKLFRGVMKAMHDILGDAAGYGMMYFATEPLDNPDYEDFEEAYLEEFDMIPQITTAVCDRDVARMKRLLAKLGTHKSFIHRFTLRSLDMAQNVFDKFTAEELLYVELLPQYPESPVFVPYTVVGNEADRVKPENVRKDDPGTICCVDGFRINFCKKTLSVFTPCHMSSIHPRGISEIATVTFTDADDFRNKLLEMIDTYFVNDLPREYPLKLYDYFHIEHTDTGDRLISSHGGETLFLDKLPGTLYKNVIMILAEGKLTKREIARKLNNETPENVFYVLNQLWKKGFIADPVFFPEIYENKEV